MVHLILKLSGPLSPFPLSIYSFRDPQEVIEGHSPPHNGLWNPRYIFMKIWYIHEKIWYILSLYYWDPHIPSHGPFDHLGTLGKWLEDVPHLSTNFGTLGTSWRKFGTSLKKFVTSNPQPTKTPISLPKVHLFL